MNYYKQQGCEEESHLSFLEVDDEGQVMRVVDIRPDSKEFPIVSSNVELLFPEGELDWEELIKDPDNPFPVCRISKDEFELQWQKNIRRNLERWNDIKGEYPLGSRVRGGIIQYAGSTVLVKIEPLVYGVVPMSSVLEGIRNFPSGPTHFRVEGIVHGHDETNQWLELEKTTFFPELFPIGTKPRFTENCP
ncbi:MAG: hypothetical protein KC800_24860 [Candidatus Eremiobacteraeota bacterium]|nr:hypothetical protein [Candidatus Eremiobacteraeota bacterium]